MAMNEEIGLPSVMLGKIVLLRKTQTAGQEIRNDWMSKLKFKNKKKAKTKQPKLNKDQLLLF